MTTEKAQTLEAQYSILSSANQKAETFISSKFTQYPYPQKMESRPRRDSPMIEPPSDSRSPPDEEAEQVMSEIHLGCPPGYSGPHISRFIICLPPSITGDSLRTENDDAVDRDLTSSSGACDLDEDGDLVLTRRRKAQRDHFVVNIRHNITSSIPRVGLQLWRAELVLADFVLHKMFTSSELDGCVALELGSGTGFVGLLLARVAHTVFITDHGEEILDNCENNVLLNSGLFCPSSSVYVRELDWNLSWDAQVTEDSKCPDRYGWSASEAKALQKACVLVAADVIYNDDITDALFSTLERIMSDQKEKVLYLALEKRYNFSLDDLDVVANGYSRFRSYISEKDSDYMGRRSKGRFVGELVDLTEIPQYVRDYERGNDVELWQITYADKNP